MDSRSSLFTLLVFSTSRPCWMTSASRRSFLYAFSITCGGKGGGGAAAAVCDGPTARVLAGRAAQQGHEGR